MRGPAVKSRIGRLEALQLLELAGRGGQTSNPSWAQPIWYFDPLNRTGRADNGNDGLTPLTPVRTFNGGVIARYGTLSPILLQDTTWVPLSGSPLAGTDPIDFSPIVSNGAQCVFQGLLDAHTKVGSGILAGVAPKNYVAGALLAADLGALAAPNRLIINTTPGKESAAWTWPVGAVGTTFQLTQPLTRTTLPISIPTYVDTWANGDTFDAYDVDMVEFAQVAPVFGEDMARFYIQQLGILGTPGAASPFYRGSGVVMQECRCDRSMALLQNAALRKTYGINCAFTDPFGVNGGQTQASGFNLLNAGPSERFIGGYGAFNISSAILDSNIIIAGIGATSTCDGSVWGSVYLGVEGVTTTRDMTVTPFFADGPRVWGPGTLYLERCHMFYSGATAVATFINTAVLTPGVPLVLDGLSFGMTATQANPSVINGHVLATPANIDAASAGNGYGIFSPVGSSISQNA